MTCVTCGAAVPSGGRPMWKPVFCASTDATPGGLVGERPEATVERRACVVCGRAFCVRSHRPHTICSAECQRQVPAWNRLDRPAFRGGRWFINCRDGSSMPYARAVMAAHIGRLLTPEDIVHHRNGDCTDDRLENLQLTDRAEHMEIHRGELLAARMARKQAA